MTITYNNKLYPSYTALAAALGVSRQAAWKTVKRAQPLRKNTFHPVKHSVCLCCKVSSLDVVLAPNHICPACTAALQVSTNPKVWLALANLVVADPTAAAFTQEKYKESDPRLLRAFAAYCRQQ